MKIVFPYTGVSTFASRTSPITSQSLQKNFHLFHPDKIVLKKCHYSSENRKYVIAQTDTDKQGDSHFYTMTMVYKDDRIEHQQPIE